MAIGGVGRIPVVSSFLDIATRLAEIRGYLEYLRGKFDRDRVALLNLADEVRFFLQGVGFREWSEYWHIGRQLISLQHRLLFEQVYSDMGEPWSKLVTGFGTIESAPGGRRDEIDPEALGRGLGIDFERAKRQSKRKYGTYQGSGGF